MENRYLVMGVVGGRNMEWWASQNKKWEKWWEESAVTGVGRKEHRGSKESTQQNNKQKGQNARAQQQINTDLRQEVTPLRPSACEILESRSCLCCVNWWRWVCVVSSATQLVRQRRSLLLPTSWITNWISILLKEEHSSVTSWAVTSDQRTFSSDWQTVRFPWMDSLNFLQHFPWMFEASLFIFCACIANTKHKTWMKI